MLLNAINVVALTVRFFLSLFSGVEKKHGRTNCFYAFSERFEVEKMSLFIAVYLAMNMHLFPFIIFLQGLIESTSPDSFISPDFAPMTNSLFYSMRCKSKFFLLMRVCR
jgi:hypothetical protein